jgi:ribosomal protein L22
MSPETPGDPQKGKVDEAAVPEEAKEAARGEAPAEAAEQPEPKPKRTRKKKAEETPVAADATGIDKAAAEASEETPKRRRRPKDEDKNPEGTKPEGTKEPAVVAATDEKTQQAVAEQPAKRDRRRRPEPGILVNARAKYVRTSARKARLVCDHIRGKDVAEARSILAFTPRAAAKPWLKLLESAVANAEHNHELVGEDLRIVAVHADEGPTLKRFRPRAMGRATRIRKRTSHLSITLTPKES